MSKENLQSSQQEIPNETTPAIGEPRNIRRQSSSGSSRIYENKTNPTIHFLLKQTF
jgi:hypothetical protein